MYSRESLKIVIQKVAIVIHEGVQALDVAGPVDVFAEANAFVDAQEGYEVVLVGASRNTVRASNGMQIAADLTFEEAVERFDILLIAGGPDLPDKTPDPVMLEWLRQAPLCANIYGSICTGAFALGYAGLLDGKRVTTHWQNARQLAERFPDAIVEHDRIHIRDGHLMTSAGVTAGIDLALALVAEHYGHSVAIAVAKRLVVVAQRHGGQSQFSPYLLPPADPRSKIGFVQNHVMGNLAGRHTLQSLAQHVGMSARNLARHFVRETGITPHEFVERARVDAARVMLEATDHPLKVVAFDCGFRTADRMREIFTERLGVTPNQYRTNFRCD